MSFQSCWTMKNWSMMTVRTLRTTIGERRMRTQMTLELRKTQVLKTMKMLQLTMMRMSRVMVMKMALSLVLMMRRK